jgi:hypothetical protein
MTSRMSNDVETLMAIEEIRRLKARYFACVDGRKWDAFATLFTQDATMDARQSFHAVHPVTGEPFVHGKAELMGPMNAEDMLTTGADKIAALGKSLLPREILSVHHGHMAEIDVESTDRARGVWAFEDRLLFLSDISPMRELHGFGHYHETYRRVDGEWKIATCRLTRLRVDVH